MKAISLWQPYASLVAVGAKRYETRSWKPHAGIIGQRLAIHAGLSFKGWSGILGGSNPGITSVLTKHNILLGHGSGSMAGCAPVGAIIAVVTVADAHHLDPAMGDADAVRELVSADEIACGDWSPGRWVWRLTDLVKLPTPIPYKGAQGIFNIADGVLRQ